MIDALPTSLREKFQRIKLLILDVDGVLTNGVMLFTPQGEELKGFHAQDGMGLRLLQDSGVEIGIITRRTSKALAERLNQLQIRHVYQGQLDKSKALNDILKQLSLNLEDLAYVGDDIPDLVVMRQVGLAIAVANATPPAIRIAHYQTQKRGGEGAVREVCEMIMEAQGTWQKTLEAYL